MNIIERNIKDLIPADYNPRLLMEKDYQDLKKSLEKFGMVDPVIVNTHHNRKNIIIGGHQRLRVWSDLGHTTVPTVEVCLDIWQERELNIRLNKNTGKWDYDTLANLFDPQDLFEYGFTADDLGVALEDLEVQQKRKNRWIKLCYDEQTYEKVIEKLMALGESPEEALIKILKLK